MFLLSLLFFLQHFGPEELILRRGDSQSLDLVDSIADFVSLRFFGFAVVVLGPHGVLGQLLESLARHLYGLVALLERRALARQHVDCVALLVRAVVPELEDLFDPDVRHVFGVGLEGAAAEDEGVFQVLT